MTDYAIAEFWEPLLRSNARGSKELQGWERVENPVEGFCEAPLSPMKIDGLDATDPDKAKVFLISSPGAVGKTTLARELAAKTGAILVDLSKTEPMSGNSLTGGLDKMELLERFKKGKTSVIVDGLDEGRMRVHGGDGFESFVGDVVHLVKNHANSKPIVLLGRSIAVEEAWLTLNAAGINPAVFQIDYYDADKAIEFVKLQIAVKVRRKGGPVNLNPVTQRQKEAIRLYLEALRELVHKGDANQFTQSFAGYSPVLMAVAESVFREANVQQLVNRLEKGDEPVSLRGIAVSILEREQGKIEQVTLQKADQEAKKRLYTPAEQLARLAARYAYNGIEKEVSSFARGLVPKLSNEDQEQYETAIRGFLEEHPFLIFDQEARRLRPSEIFGGLIAVDALGHAKYPDAVKEVVRTAEISRGVAANPFISHFYMEILDGDPVRTLPADHVDLLYISVCAGLALGHVADLKIQEENAGHKVKITKTDKEGKPIARGEYRAEGDKFAFDSHQMKNIDICSDKAEVHIGTGGEVTFVPPVTIEASKGITLAATKLVVDYPSRPLKDQPNMVFLNTGMLITDCKAEPTIREGAQLQIAAPNLVWPLDQHFVKPDCPEQENMREALRRLKNMLRSMKSTAYGGRRAAHELIESLSQGTPEVLQHLLNEKVFAKDGEYYQLDTDVLAEKVGLNLDQVHGAGYSEKTIHFLTNALKKRH